MNIRSLFIGLIIGLALGFIVTKYCLTNKASAGMPMRPDSKSVATKWRWADSLDAVKAAAPNHRVVFENDKIRILEVLLRPHEFEKMHTHKLPSVMFSSNSMAAPSFDIVYYRYGYDQAKHQYFVKDSIKQHNDASEANVPDTGNYMRPEGPHAIKNLSNVTIDVFRVEFKK